jgi:ATP-dependent helicase/nuclease subunit B
MELFDYLTPTTLILTPNRRLSAALLKRYNLERQSANESCWATLPILPFPSFIQQLWQTYSDTQIADLPTLLSSNQEQILWEEILRESAAGDYLLQLSTTAELARAAWNTLQLWNVDLQNQALATTEDSQIFLEWAQKFQHQCEQKNWLASSSVAALLVEKINTTEITPASRYVLTGFTELAPLYQTLLEACAARGSEIIHYQAEASANTISRLALRDEDTEIECMARWAKSLWDKNPDARVGCVFPRLEAIRAKVVKKFAAVFTEAGTYSLQTTRYPFNISAGKNLSLYPVINTALQLLKMPANNLPLGLFNHILQSPFVGVAESEMLARAQFTQELQRANLARISLKGILSNQYPRLNLTTSCPALALHLQNYAALKKNKKATQPVSQWIDIFMQQLNCLGWPGERSLNSEEYQVVDSWLKLLVEYSAFDKFLPAVNYNQALHYLSLLTAKKIFQPESPDAPIQILGLLEATEYPFDHLWVMGLDDTLWPPAPKPNPFIPQRLQKTLQMPHATAERELAYCQQLTEQLKRGAPQVMFSYPLHNEEAECRHSPIITSISEITIAELELADFTAPAQLLYASKKTEIISDETAPALTAAQSIRGGTSLFKLQAACPFKAFAELRLHARKIDEPTSGLSASERGDVLHKALEIFWLVIKDSVTLQQLNADALQIQLVAAIEEALLFLNAEALANLRYRGLEAARLLKILTAWMEIEKTRLPFKIHAIEQEHTITIAGLSLKVRIDRIDEVESGKKIIIDYKTGKTVTEKNWFGPRPEEPQLPLYCTLDPININGLLFAQINSEKMAFKGISQQDLGFKDIKPLEKNKYATALDWSDQIRQWHATLTHLAEDFIAGVACVDPKQRQETCRNCHLHALCRIDTTQEVLS